MKRPWFNTGFSFGAAPSLGWGLLRLDGKESKYLLAKPNTRGCALVTCNSVDKSTLTVKLLDSYPEFAVEFEETLLTTLSTEIIPVQPRWAWDVVGRLKKWF
jgi:hypothetical protein